MRAHARFAAVLGVLVLSACDGGGEGSRALPAGVSDTLVAQAAQFTTPEDTTLSASLTAQSAGGSPAYALVARPAHGSVQIAGASFTYTPAKDYFGPDEFRYQASEGRLRSAPATVAIDVTPVNDPPVLQSVSGPDHVNCGAEVKIDVVVTDPDDATTQLDVEQVSGTQVGVATVTAESIAFAAPVIASSEVVRLRIDARDGHGGEASRDFSLRLLPLSPSAKLRTIYGSPTAPGLHLVITGDGYTAAEQEKLYADALAIRPTLIEAPEIAPYASAWNVHVLSAVSAESGVDIPSEGVFRDTVFDGTLSCHGEERLLCVSQAKVMAAAAAEFPAYSLLAVISNTDRYGGSGGTILVASRHPSSALIAFHEMGHSFAHLVDEYVDASLDTGPIVPFPEADVPNATAVLEPGLVKWRYWFADAAAVPRAAGERGVGLFEGGLFRTAGVFRPTYDSFMRSLGTPMGPVNAEAWLLAMYQRLGAVRAVRPLAKTVVAPAGQPVSMSVQPTFGTLEGIQWFEDGAEVPASADPTTFQCCSQLSGTRVVSVQVRDVSGRIARPPPSPAFFERSWQVSFQ